MLETLQSIFLRDLSKLKKEIGLYGDEKNLWLVANDVHNSAGNLCLHLIGNLTHFIGVALGDSGYVRQRDLEFSLKNIPREELLQKIDDTASLVGKTLSAVPPDQLKQEYPVLVFEQKTSTEYMLVHLATHLGYHLGQINYHRRLLDK